jgi:hypothetical protein
MKKPLFSTYFVLRYVEIRGFGFWKARNDGTELQKKNDGICHRDRGVFDSSRAPAGETISAKYESV